MTVIEHPELERLELRGAQNLAAAIQKALRVFRPPAADHLCAGGAGGASDTGQPAKRASGRCRAAPKGLLRFQQTSHSPNLGDAPPGASELSAVERLAALLIDLRADVIGLRDEVASARAELNELFITSRSA